jgi:hypothetical protein
MPGKFETTRVLLSHAGKISINANEIQDGYQTSLSYRPVGVSTQTVGREAHSTSPGAESAGSVGCLLGERRVGGAWL